MTGAVAYVPPGDTPTRRPRLVVLAVYWVVLAVIVGIAAVVTVAGGTEEATPRCARDRNCPGPPARALGPTATWAVAGLGVRLEYPTDVFTVHRRARRTLQLVDRSGSVPDGVHVAVWVTAVPTAQRSAASALDGRVRQLRQGITGLVADDDPSTAVAGLRIGDRRALGGSYRGVADGPQGPLGPAVVAVAAANDPLATVVISHVVTGTDDPDEIGRLRAAFAPVMTTFAWGTR